MKIGAPTTFMNCRVDWLEPAGCIGLPASPLLQAELLLLVRVSRRAQPTLP